MVKSASCLISRIRGICFDGKCGACRTIRPKDFNCIGSCRKCIQVGSFQCDNGRAFLCSVVAPVYQISVHLNSGKLGEVSVTPDGDITITVMRPTTVCSINNLIGVIRCVRIIGTARILYGQCCGITLYVSCAV